MIFLANRANLDRRTLYRRIHDILASQIDDNDSAVKSVRYENVFGITQPISTYNTNNT